MKPGDERVNGDHWVRLLLKFEWLPVAYHLL